MRILATDIGGTNARAALIELRSKNHEVRNIHERPTPESREELLSWLEPFARDADAIALAIAGVVRDHRFVRNAPNIPFIEANEIDLGGEVADKLKKPCTVFNDMEAALAGEVAAGALKDVRWAFMDTVSTGWGGALLLNGAIVASEPGHTPSGLFENRQCILGHTDCNEAHFSGRAVEERVRLILKAHPPSRRPTGQAAKTAAGKSRSPKDVNPNQIADEAVRNGEPWATELYRYVAEGIGRAWAYRLTLIPTIEKIVYTGGFLVPAMEIPLFRDTVRQTIASWTPASKDIPIERARAEHGALLGTVFLLRQS
jgi:glucokinase